MYDYKAPIKDFEFTYFELFDYEQHYLKFHDQYELDRETAMAILLEAAKFSENILAPLNQSGDEQGCQLNEGEVKTPKGFLEAYQHFVAAGWPSMVYPSTYGGQGLPESLWQIIGEMLSTANPSWATYPGLSHGAKNTLLAYGTDEQKDHYLTKLISGEWTATMCLTEPHCGTDLGILTTKAVPNKEGSWSITGNKIFITSGEHDLTDNIIHIVLARLPDAPAGTAGISLFVIPKYTIEADGSIGTRNGVQCVSIEKKMGIKASVTCALNFEAAKGFLLGKPNQGLQAMFVFMNVARLAVAMQGLCHTELGLQKSVGYAKDRLQMRSLTGPKNPTGPADPIIVHPDVRRMLLTQKAMAEGGRMLVAYCGKLIDTAREAADSEARQAANNKLALLTPIAKAFMTEVGFECASLALQCFGGHGYIKEWGVEQNLRDARISMLYEGTTGVQALDLLGRKVLKTKGELLKPLFTEILGFSKQHPNNKLAVQLPALVQRWQQLTQSIGIKALSDADEIGAASVDYLMYSGYCLYAYLWAMAAIKAEQCLQEGRGDAEFYQAKIAVANFYFQRILPRIETCERTIQSGAANLMSMPEQQFLRHL